MAAANTPDEVQAQFRMIESMLTVAQIPHPRGRPALAAGTSLLQVGEKLSQLCRGAQEAYLGIASHDCRGTAYEIAYQQEHQKLIEVIDANKSLSTQLLQARETIALHERLLEAHTFSGAHSQTVDCGRGVFALESIRNEGRNRDRLKAIAKGLLVGAPGATSAIAGHAPELILDLSYKGTRRKSL